MNWIFEYLWWPFLLLPALSGMVVLVSLVLKKLGVNISATWLQGIKNAFFAFLIVGVLAGTIALFQKFWLGQSAHNELAISYEILFSITIFWLYFNLFSLKQKAGRELLDIAPFPVGCLTAIIGAVSTVFGFLGYADVIWKDTPYSWLVSIVIGLAGGAFFIIISFSHVRIHENGIVAYLDLIKWSRFESFEWIENNEKSYTLKLRYKGKMPSFLRNGAMSVPIEKKKQVEALLAQFLPGD
jgi:hypothetical protein